MKNNLKWLPFRGRGLIIRGMKPCKCGCGTLIEPTDSRNRPRSYVWGHANIELLIESARNREPWNKGKKTGQTPWNKGRKGYMAGSQNPFYGKKHTEETRAKMRGARNGNWRNGASRKNDLIRKSVEYIDWRTAVFLRDCRKCVWCGSGENIEADHIKPFSTYPELRFNIDNGRTLCKPCHRTTDTYGNTKKTRVVDE